MSYILNLEMDGRNVPVQIEGQKTVISKHTGKELLVIEGRVAATGEDTHKWFMDALDKFGSEGVWSHPHPTYGRARWTVARGSYSVTNNENYSYAVVLQSAENLELDSLEIDGIRLFPYRYKEELSGDLLFIRALVELSEGEREQIRDRIENGSRFLVIRHGINENPVEMRFGMCAWSAHEGKFKYSLYLVDIRYDKDEPPHVSEVEKSNRDRHLLLDSAFMLELRDLLVQKGLLTQDELDGLNDRTTQRATRVRHGFTQVNDIEELKF